MKKERIAMTGDSLNFNLGRVLQTMEPDLSGIAVTNSGEVIEVSAQEPAMPSPSESVSAETGRGT
jgi:hypothetical protein